MTKTPHPCPPTHTLSFDIDPSMAFDMVAKVGDGGSALGIRMASAVLAAPSVVDLIGMAVYGVTNVQRVALAPVDAPLMENREFRRVWRSIIRAWKKHPHAFARGCGRESLAHWVRDAGGGLHSPNYLRRALNEAVRRGWVEKFAEPGRCTRFALKVS